MRNPSEPAIEETESGFRIKNGVREVDFTDEDALRLWIALGLMLDHRTEGQLNKATRGGLGALRRQYLERRRQKVSD